VSSVACVVDLRARRGYKPDVASLACSKVAGRRKQTGLSVAAFAAALEPLLGWAPAPDLVRTWECDVPPAGQVVVACESSRPARPGSARR
jgi:hypothetical protein